MTTTPKSYDYGRFYARSEKHLTDVLNERAGKGNWIKTKVMIDAYGNSHKAIDGRDPVPTFPDDEDDNGGWGYSKQVYRGVVFKDATAALNVKMFVNAVDDQKPEDRVLARTFNTVEIGNRARIYGLPASGLPWETKAEADAALAQARAAQDAFHKSLREDFEGRLDRKARLAELLAMATLTIAEANEARELVPEVHDDLMVQMEAQARIGAKEVR